MTDTPPTALERALRAAVNLDSQQPADADEEVTMTTISNQPHAAETYPRPRQPGPDPLLDELVARLGR